MLGCLAWSWWDFRIRLVVDTALVRRVIVVVRAQPEKFARTSENRLILLATERDAKWPGKRLVLELRPQSTVYTGSLDGREPVMHPTAAAAATTYMRLSPAR